MKKNTYMHFKEESIIYIWSKFQLNTCMFDSNILLTKFGPGFWSRVPGVSPGFYSFPTSVSIRRLSPVATCKQYDNGYPHDGRADKNPYPHDRRADKDSYPHDSNNQCIILRLQLSFAMINVQLMLV